MFCKTTKELNVLLLSSTFPKPAVARYQRLCCTSQESTRMKRYTRIHVNTKKVRKFREKTHTKNTRIEAEQDGTIGQNTTTSRKGHAAFR